MTKKEVINVMSKFDFTNERITTTGDTFQIGYWDYAKKNKKGERLTISINCCYNEKSEHCLPMLWYRAGYTDRLILNYLSLDTYVYLPNGECCRRYDFTKESEDGKRLTIDFDWVLEQSEENLEKMVKEILRRFNA